MPGDEAAAWTEYLDTIRAAPARKPDDAGDGYEAVESWAWAKLRQRLRALAPSDAAGYSGDRERETRG
jgi:hypothetical protein